MNSLFLGVATFPCCNKPHMILASFADRAEAERVFAETLREAGPGFDGKATASMLVEIAASQLPALAELLNTAVHETIGAILEDHPELLGMHDAPENLQ